MGEKATKNVLVIDFNYIMSHYVKLYEPFMSSSENPVMFWNRLENQLEIDDKLHFDYNILKKLALIMSNSVSGGAKLYPITQEMEFVHMIKDTEGYETTKYNLYHIGYKHNIFYTKNDIRQIVDFEKYKSVDWIGYLILNDKINELTWFKSYNSELLNYRFQENVSCKLNVKGKDDLDELCGMQFDEIYFALSPDWVPYKFHYLYDLIVSLLIKDGVSI